MKALTIAIGIISTAVLADRSFADEKVAKPVPRPVVVVVDGAGDLKGCSNAFARGKALYDLPVDVEVFAWSHGHYKILKDQVDDKHILNKGKELAARLAQLRRADAERPIVLVSYSAGCGVGLSAGRHLPPDTIDRHFVMCPSVSRKYDLRPSLRATRHGIDVHCSKKDKWALGVAMRLVGTADELHDREAAGRHGFTPVVEDPGDADLYRKVRHVFWTPEDRKLGHNGLHHGVHAPGYLNKYVFPLLTAAH